MKLTDICVNLTNGQFNADRDDIVRRARAVEVQMVVTGTDLDSTREAIELSRSFGRRCTAGVHPHDADGVAGDWLAELRSLADATPVCAIGETGLDFNRNYSPRAAQEAVFSAQIELAQQLDLPLFVHDRDSDGAVYALLQRAGALPPTTIHCFTGSEQDLRNYVEAGYFIGITGWITETRRGAQLRRLAPLIPAEQLLIETDAPFLRPHNVPAAFMDQHGLDNRHRRRNEPALLRYVCEAVAACRSETPAELAAITRSNAPRALRLSD